MVGATKVAMTHPFGGGLKMHNVLLPDLGHGWTGVHNVYLEVAADVGIAGGVLYIVILWKLFTSMGRIRAAPEQVAGQLPRLADAIQGSMVAFLVGGFFLAVAYLFPIYILLGMAVAVKEMAGRLPQTAVERKRIRI
jgi:hypothetical protein